MPASPYANVTFGGLLTTGNSDTAVIREREIFLPAAREHVVTVYVLVDATASAEVWLEQVQAMARADAAVPMASRWQAHTAFWRAFWARSFVRISPVSLFLNRFQYMTLRIPPPPFFFFFKLISGPAARIRWRQPPAT